jgi:hypothetical protein
MLQDTVELNPFAGTRLTVTAGLLVEETVTEAAEKPTEKLGGLLVPPPDDPAPPPHPEIAAINARHKRVKHGDRIER